jgi:hypothetical protein
LCLEIFEIDLEEVKAELELGGPDAQYLNRFGAEPVVISAKHLPIR